MRVEMHRVRALNSFHLRIMWNTKLKVWK